MRRSLIVTLLLASAASAGQISSIPLVDIDPQAVEESGQYVAGVLPTTDESWGWAFTVHDEYRATVTHMAWYDTNRDGLSHAHSVGIWRDTISSYQYWPILSENELVTEAVVPAGTLSELDGSWRRIAIEPVVLGPGKYQVVGQNRANSTDDLVFWQPSSSPRQPRPVDGIVLNGLSSDQPEFGPVRLGGWLTSSPNTPLIRGTLTGPMLFAEVKKIVIPEPSTVLLMLVACVMKMNRFVRVRRT